ncbi:MAG: hypothetical protein LUC18_03975, partial [Porphyromonadaceae bacterium]|nr:hypothetical protein [Porphyromonadaceae bacterium]
MKKNCLLVVALLFTLLRPIGAWGQVDSAVLALADLVKAYNRFGMYNPQEKVYLHFDNTGYYLGETIWFQAYVVAAPQLRPTELSKVLYVELLTPEGRVVETKKLKIEEGRANGEFLLTDGTLVGGFYEVRAYTRVMLNWEGTYFSRIFPIFDRPDREGIYPKKMTKRPRSKALPQYREEASSQPALNLAFFPEGGNLVEGLPSVVAFKATDKEGRSCEVTGSVTDNSGNPVAEITTQHQGMGKFLLTPETGPYKASVTWGGKEYRFTLPTVQREGYVMTVNTLRDDKLFFQVQRSSGLPGEWVGITVSCRGITYAFDVADMREKSSIQMQFAEEAFPSGVLQITLFNARGDVLAERLAFHDSKPQVTLRIDSLKPLYKPFEPVNLHFTVSDSRQENLPSTFSLSVRDYATEVPTYYQGDMRTNFLLESDLRGYIENISYYFESDDAEHRDNLDLLMRVQGWRRYAWRQLAGLESFEPHHPVEEGILVKGQVYRYRMTGSRPEPDVNVSIWVYSPSFSCKGTVQSDDAGRFAFLSDSDIWDRCEMILRTQTPDKNGELKDRDLVVELDRVFSPKPESYPATALTLPDSNLNRITYALEDIEEEEEEEEEELSMDKKIHNLNEVSVKAKRQPLSDRPTIVYSVADEEDRLIDT